MLSGGLGKHQVKPGLAIVSFLLLGTSALALCIASPPALCCSVYVSWRQWWDEEGPG